MSTILKTLKKLEEEKNILRHKGDLKELVLQGDEGDTLQGSSAGLESWIWIAGGVLFGVLITGGLFYFSQPDMPTSPLPKTASGNIVKRPVAVTKPTDKTTRTVPGIPLENIPESERPVELSPEPFSKEDPPVAIPADPIEEPIEPVAKETQGPRELAEEPIREIDELIKSATLAENEEVEKPREVLSRTAVHFPEMRVKGIIFFDEGNLSNHIFVSTPKTNNLKLKVGDEVEKARLESITSQAAIFKYQGNLVELPIGE
jgi:hypothetical protein